jgi:hypothetical protein
MKIPKKKNPEKKIIKKLKKIKTIIVIIMILPVHLTNLKKVRKIEKIVLKEKIIQVQNLILLRKNRVKDLNLV